VSTVLGRDERRDHPAPAGTDHNDVEVTVRLYHLVPQLHGLEPMP
jgi:hypothetical protein